jgi:hypothetical protein
MPENLEFWIPQTVVLWILLLGANRQLPPFVWKKNYLLYGGLSLILFVVNYFGSIRWMKDLENDSVYVKIKKVKEQAAAKDIILLQDPWLLDDFLQHFTPSTIAPVPSDGPAIAGLDRQISNSLATGGKIYLFTEGTSMHASPNKNFMDSLLHSPGIRVTDLQNELTPVKVISPAQQVN